MSWPPAIGEPLPRATEAVGVREKLAGYSLALGHEVGGPKARGFQRILGITLADIDYLEGAILTGILVLPINTTRENLPWGINCTVIIPVRGRRQKSARVAPLRTAWLVARDTPPRLVNAFLKP